MIEPVHLDNFFITFFSSAMVIMLGACYALLFALAKLGRRKSIIVWAYFSYALLAINVIVLSQTLNLYGFWQLIVWVMLIGYLVAPHGVWYLCEGTHSSEHNSSTLG